MSIDAGTREHEQGDRALTEPLWLAGLAVGAFAFVGVLYPRYPALFPTCPSLSIFGVYCPLCGGTRSAYALVTGDLPAMVSYNALVPLLLVLAAWGWVAWVARLRGWARVPSIPRPRLVGVTFAVLAVVYGVARNIPWEPLAVLAP